MIKKTILFSTLLSLVLAFGCAEMKDAIKDITHPKEEKKTKTKPPAETPKEATTQKQPDTTVAPKESTTSKDSPASKDTTTKSTTTPAKKPATSSESSGSVFGPK
jgi:hypothetical protein